MPIKITVTYSDGKKGEIKEKHLDYNSYSSSDDPRAKHTIMTTMGALWDQMALPDDIKKIVIERIER